MPLSFNSTPKRSSQAVSAAQSRQAITIRRLIEGGNFRTSLSSNSPRLIWRSGHKATTAKLLVRMKRESGSRLPHIAFCLLTYTLFGKIVRIVSRFRYARKRIMNTPGNAITKEIGRASDRERVEIRVAGESDHE